MPRLKPSTQAARRGRILDAAEICIARAGFHRTTMQDIAKAAGVSLGALYVYFESKEALIAGISERDRSKFYAQLAGLAEAPDLVDALGKLGEHYTVEEPQHKRVLCVEIGAEATRNEAVGEIYRNVDRDVMEAFTQLFERARAQGRIAPAFDLRTVTMMLGVIGDGLFWRRALDPTFDVKTLMPAVSMLLGTLLNPVNPTTPPVPYAEATGETDKKIDEMSS